MFYHTNWKIWELIKCEIDIFIKGKKLQTKLKNLILIKNFLKNAKGYKEIIQQIRNLKYILIFDGISNS